MDLTNIDFDFQSIKLSDKHTEGMQSFWSYIMECMDDKEKVPFSRLKIGTSLSSGIGGYFINQKQCHRIALGYYAVINDNVVEFIETTDADTKITYSVEENFARFMHEASHFLHLSYNEGTFNAVPLQGIVRNEYEMLAIKNRRDIEFEAWYRSFWLNYEYKCIPMVVVNEINIRNMSNYDTIVYSDETDDVKSKYMDSIKDNKELLFKVASLATKQIMAKYPRLRDWYDKERKLEVDIEAIKEVV